MWTVLLISLFVIHYLSAELYQLLAVTDRPTPVMSTPVMTVMTSTSFSPGHGFDRYSVKQPSPVRNKIASTFHYYIYIVKFEISPYFPFLIANYQTRPWYMFDPYPGWRLMTRWKEINYMISRLDHNCLDMFRRDTRPRYYIRDQDQDQGSNPQDQDQDSKNPVLRLSRDETVSRDFPSLPVGCKSLYISQRFSSDLVFNLNSFCMFRSNI